MTKIEEKNKKNIEIIKIVNFYTKIQNLKKSLNFYPS
jgi:hypothetical protein